MLTIAIVMAELLIARLSFIFVNIKCCCLVQCHSEWVIKSRVKQNFWELPIVTIAKQKARPSFSFHTFTAISIKPTRFTLVAVCSYSVNKYHRECIKTHHFDIRNAKILWEGAQPPPQIPRCPFQRDWTPPPCKILDRPLQWRLSMRSVHCYLQNSNTKMLYYVTIVYASLGGLWT